MRSTVGLLFLIGCSRSFGTPQAPPTPTVNPGQPLGTGCSDAGACGTGACVDGVCCLTTCTASQRCDLPASLGTCSDRPIGEGCDGGAMCPGGYCVDGVCCDGPCNATCQTCAGANPGSCSAAGPNTDPHGDCAGAVCAACFGGACAPALVGTDPDGSCGDGGSVCSIDQQCGVALNAACTADADCAQGGCLGGTCLVLADDLVFTSSMDPLADARDVAATAINSEGDRAILFTESAVTFNVEDDGSLGANPDKNEVYLALQPAGDVWHAVPLYTASDLSSANVFPALGRAFFLGRQAIAVVALPADPQSSCETDAGRCGLVALSVAATGEQGQTDPIDSAAIDAVYVDGLVDSQGHLVVTYTDGRGFHVRRREAWGHWTALSDLATLPGIVPNSSPALAATNSALYFVYTTEVPGVRVSFVDGGSGQELDLGGNLNCPGYSPDDDLFDTESGKGPPQSDHLTLSVMCNDAFLEQDTTDDPGSVYRVTFTPGSSNPWQVELIGEKLGYAQVSSAGDWVIYVHQMPQNPLSSADVSSYGQTGVGWRDATGHWTTEDLHLTSVPQPYPTVAMSSEASGIPFMAYGVDAFETEDLSVYTTPPPVQGTEVHAVSIER